MSLLAGSIETSGVRIKSFVDVVVNLMRVLTHHVQVVVEGLKRLVEVKDTLNNKDQRQQEDHKGKPRVVPKFDIQQFSHPLQVRRATFLVDPLLFYIKSSVLIYTYPSGPVCTTTAPVLQSECYQ